MKANDYLWVGLKLLGVYMIVHGAATLSGGMYYVLVIPTPGGLWKPDYVQATIWQHCTDGAIFMLAGIVLVSCAGMFASRTCDDQPHDS